MHGVGIHVAHNDIYDAPHCIFNYHGNDHIIEYSLKLDSNPEFTSSVLIAYARAAYRLNKEGQTGCKTVFDIAPAYLCKESGDYLRSHML